MPNDPEIKNVTEIGTTVGTTAATEPATGARTGTQKPLTDEEREIGSLLKLPKEELVNIIHDTRSEAATRRHQLRDTEKERDDIKVKLSAIEKAQLEEQGKYKELNIKLADELAQEKIKNQTRLIKAELRATAIREGIIDDDVVNLIPISEVKFDDAGNLVGVKEAVASFKIKKAHFFHEPDSHVNVDIGVTTTGKKPPTQQLSPGPTDVRKMSKEDYSVAKKKVLGNLRGGK